MVGFSASPSKYRRDLSATHETRVQLFKRSKDECVDDRYLVNAVGFSSLYLRPTFLQNLVPDVDHSMRSSIISKKSLYIDAQRVLHACKQLQSYVFIYAITTHE